MAQQDTNHLIECIGNDTRVELRKDMSDTELSSSDGKDIAVGDESAFELVVQEDATVAMCNGTFTSSSISWTWSGCIEMAKRINSGGHPYPVNPTDGFTIRNCRSPTVAAFGGFIRRERQCRSVAHGVDMGVPLGKS